VSKIWSVNVVFSGFKRYVRGLDDIKNDWRQQGVGSFDQYVFDDDDDRIAWFDNEQSRISEPILLKKNGTGVIELVW
jgi:hypothetical protein